MVIVYMDSDVSPRQKLFERPDPVRMLSINYDKPCDLIQLDILDSFYVGRIEDLDEIPDSLLHRSRKDDYGLRVKLFGRNGGGQGIEVAVNMRSENIHI